MPNIVIRERDLSDAARIDITENAVYVPGVATWNNPNNLTEDSIRRWDNVESFEEEYTRPDDNALSYQYAHELIEAGVPVYFANLPELNASSIETSLAKLTDKNNYNIKFITTGTYPVTINDTTFKKMLKIAATRGDCIALPDVGMTETLSSIKGALEAITEKQLNDDYTILITGDKEETKESTLKYAAMVAPWGTYITKQYGEVKFPGSFAYLSCLAKSTVNYPNWYAIAGINRGYVNNLKNLEVNVTGSEADNVQTVSGISIIPITYINPTGYCIWGNRTLHKNDKDDLVASSFLNIRMLACDVKKTLYTAAKELMFETDSMQLWLDFKSKVTPLLDKMVSGNGLTDYSIKRVKSNMKATLKVVVTLYCIEAIENFDITLNITDSTVEVAE